MTQSSSIVRVRLLASSTSSTIRNMYGLRSISILLAWLMVWSWGISSKASAQESKSKTTRPVAAKSTTSQANREISVTESFSPTFAIEPLSHRLSGRENEVLPFAFKIEPKNKDAEVEVSTIGLRQELTGQILYEENSGQADLVQLLTPTSLPPKPM